MDPIVPRRKMLIEAAKDFLLKKAEPKQLPPAKDEPPRLTPRAIESTRMFRTRTLILANLDEMYREAFQRAKEQNDDAQLVSLDFAYRREQLYFEVLLDIREAMERR
jgi:hypothetical protein